MSKPNLPTLMLKGMLQSPNGDPNLKKKLDEWIPVEYVIDWFRSRLSKTGIENRVLVLKSETASGKSTMFPPELYKALVRGTGDHAPGIICTQPRVMTAIENVNEMLKHYSKVMRLGESIGWSTKFNKLRPKSVGLLSATIGTLAQQLKTLDDEEIMKKYRFILIDETHERDLQTDMTISMLKNLLLRNQNDINCPFVVLMSATFDPNSFLEFFKIPLFTNFIWCAGETAGFDEMWDWNQGRTVNNYPQGAMTVVEKIVRNNQDDDPARADILIFMPGKGEFTQTAEWLTKLNQKFAQEKLKVMSILQIDGAAVQSRNLDYVRTMYIPVSEHEVTIDGVVYKPSRRVIICTNVAETGLTLDNLRYVIDAGFNREIEYNPVYGIRGLITKPAPKSRIRQRRGRAGRKFRGVFYPLYPQYIYDKLPDLQFPQILIEDVSIIMLDIINEQLKVKLLGADRDPQFSVNDIDMIDVPTPDSLASCLEKLYSLGFISPTAPKWDIDSKNIITAVTDPTNHLDERFGITKLGAVATMFSMITPECVRMILAAYTWGASVLDMITIAAYISLGTKSITAESLVAEPGKPPLKLNINWAPVYKKGLPGFISSPSILYKIRLLIADDFIDGLILFNAIKYIIAESDAKDSITNLQHWCKHNNISYRGCLEFIRARDDIIEQMLENGMELFAGEESAISRSTIDDFTDTVTRIKYCIYDGFRNNLLIRTGTEYKTLMGLKVTSPKLFNVDEAKLAEQNEYGFALSIAPSVVVYKELSLKYNRKTFMYDVITDRISTLDGFVSVDLDFTT